MLNRSIRNRLTELSSHIEVVAKRENSTPTIIAMYLVKLYSLDEQDTTTANVIKDYINNGNIGQYKNNVLSLDASAFLFDSLEIGNQNTLI